MQQWLRLLVASC
uniref:Uncharacterized protein n=1 Tax=Arundo donax TaxID=35708 RepID=A0A0A9AHA0_ARUDO